jgi:hypothetical protein
VRFERVAAAPNSGLSIAIPARGMAIGDLDGDGRQDVVINNMDSAPTLLRNVAEMKNHWICLKLIGDVSKKTPKDAIGSTVFATVGGVRQRFDVISGANYASQNDQRINIGLGTAAKIDKLEIYWAGGAVQTVKDLNVDRTYVIEEGKAPSIK